MNRAATYFARLRGEVRGPFTAAQLRDFAEAGVAGPETEIAVSRSGPWLRIDASAERDAVFPPARAFAFKAVNFEKLNPPDAAAPPRASDFVAAAQTEGRLLRSQREQEEAAARAAAKPAAPLNEVQAMVNAVSAIEARHAVGAVPPPRRRRRLSARLKIILTLAVLGNAVLATLPFAYDAFGDYVSMLGFKAWFVTYNGALVIAYTTMSRD